MRSLQIARGELQETRCLMLLSKELGRISEKDFLNVNSICDSLGQLINALGRSLRSKLDDRGLSRVTSHKPLAVAIVGRPNVGKSSLLNRLLGEERAIVSPVAGTTRDTVDTLLKTDEQTFRIIDTAGIRRKGKTTAMAEKLFWRTRAMGTAAPKLMALNASRVGSSSQLPCWQSIRPHR